MLQYNSTAYPNAMVDGRREIIPRKLFIGGLSYDTTDNSLAAYFSQFGEVESAIVLRDPVNSHSRGFGFVTFADDIGASNVLSQSRNHIVDGRKVEAKLAFPKTQNNHPRQQQKTTNTNQDYNPYLKMNQSNMASLGVRMPVDAFNMQMPYPYEHQPIYHNQQLNINELYLSHNPQQQFEREQLDKNIGQHMKLSAKDSCNNLSASVSSQSFQPEGRSPRSSIAEVEQYTQRDVQSLRRKTLSHIHIKADLQSGVSQRKFSGIQNLAEVSNRLQGLGLNSDQYSASTIYISGIDINTSAEEIKKFCTTFGKVKTAGMDRNGYGVVTFEEAVSADKILNYQSINGNLFFEGKEIAVTRFEKQGNDSWPEKPFTRSNTFQSQTELFGDEDSEPEKIPMMRAMSVTQSMLRPTTQPSFEDNTLQASLHLMRDEKNRSLSVIASMNKDIAKQVRVSNRRSSSFADRNLEDVEQQDLQ